MNSNSLNSGSCPLDHKQLKEQEGCPVDHTAGSNSFYSKKGFSASASDEKSCSSEDLDKRNFLPTELTGEKSIQTKWPGQQGSLGTERVVSSIPKALSSDENWVYPSEQQFFNALKRKGWIGAKEEDVSSVVSIHNNVNEKVWAKILEFEKFHCENCKTPKLLKFQGKPKQLSPKAWIKSNLLGYSKPFDRHDWIVDRCGTEIRYVIDFYQGGMSLEQKRFGQVGYYLDVRPAIDSVGSIVDRIRFSLNI